MVIHLPSHFLERVERRLLWGWKDRELDLESCGLVGGQIMRSSESKGEKIVVVCERIELATAVLNFRNQ